MGLSAFNRARRLAEDQHVAEESMEETIKTTEETELPPPLDEEAPLAEISSENTEEMANEGEEKETPEATLEEEDSQENAEKEEKKPNSSKKKGEK